MLSFGESGSALVQFLQLLGFASALVAGEGSHSCSRVPAAWCGCLMAGGVLSGWGEQKGSLLAPLFGITSTRNRDILAAGRVNKTRVQP